MKKVAYYKKKYSNFMFDHPVAKNSTDIFVGVILCFISAALLAFGFRCFIAPSQLIPSSVAGEDYLALPRIISGGLSGLTQIFVKIMQMCGLSESYANTIQSIGYAIINIPVILLAFFKIGKKFAAYSALNVVITSLLIQFLPAQFIDEISKHFVNQILSRALFAGVCAGLSSAIAFKANQSAGGIDILSFYFASRKGKSIGSYVIMFDSILVTLYTLLSVFSPDSSQLFYATGKVMSEGEYYVMSTDFLKVFAFLIVILFYSVVYMFTYGLVLDSINVRNKKMQVQIITSRPTIADILIANFPHGATLVEAKGAYTGESKSIIYMVISNSELKNVVKVIQIADPNAFINITNLQQVYGKFFIRPLE